MQSEITLEFPYSAFTLRQKDTLYPANNNRYYKR